MNNIIFVALLLYCTDLLSDESMIDSEIKSQLIIENPTNLGEPVQVRLEIKNESTNKREVITPTLEMFSKKTIVFYLLPPGSNIFEKIENPCIYIGGLKSQPPPKEIPISIILPKGSISFTFMLDYDFPSIEERNWLFNKKGNYEIKAKLFYPKGSIVGEKTVPSSTPWGQIETPSSIIEIIPPINIIDVEAYNALKSIPDEYLLYAPLVYDKDMHAKSLVAIREFVEKYKSSIYARYGYLLLAYEYLKSNKKDVLLIERCRELSENKTFPLHMEAKNIYELYTMPK